MHLTPTKRPIEYPDCDGKPMAENTRQYEWIVTIKGNLDIIFADNPDVFVAGDLLWYPVEGHPEICQAPDVLVAIGRPKIHRPSYKQWEEGGTPPHVVFEILSPGNRLAEMTRKFKFYERHGVEEYYVFDPDNIELTGWIRNNGELQEIPVINGWTSPRLGIQFDLTPERLVILRPNRSPFLTFQEIAAKLEEKDRSLLRKERDLELVTWEKEKAEKLVQELKAKLAAYEKN